ncbi:hypothetical protein [Bradyrhizobium sp. MOS003]|uniref:hypothetical protein n=1 Tax=Bradyrhizobium sp. MOS003 TaxID=2133946 RepID=UPI001314663F|nr:hypothetical protein [Bradyrhizobium sp. MOS003]
MLDGHVNMQALHGLSSQANTLPRFRAGFEGFAGAHDAPPQQFSVSNPTSAIIEMMGGCQSRLAYGTPISIG